MSVDVLIPVHNGRDLISACLDPITAQLEAGDRVVILDDASTDDTAELAQAAGAEVIRLDAGVGPYRARNAGAARSTADDIVFADARSRPRPGWLDAHKELLGRADVALSCTNVRVDTGPALAERISAVINTFDLVNYLDVPGQLDYFPTCNLGVSRTAFEAVGGFASVRSGGDADLCWRIQRSGHGRLAADRRVLMSWQPRSSLRQLVEQTFRYGKGHSTLLASYAPQESVSQTSPAGPLDRLRERLREHPHDMPAVLGSFALALPLAAGRLVAARERHR